jgi:hypothetical protein
MPIIQHSFMQISDGTKVQMPPGIRVMAKDRYVFARLCWNATDAQCRSRRAANFGLVQRAIFATPS